MEVSRRTFIKTTLIGGAGVSVFGFSLAPVYAQTQGLKIARTTETRSTCPYCSVSCGVIIHTLGDKAKNATPQVVHVEGDPDHPINRGTLCPKGASLDQDIVNERRLIKPQVRRPGSDHWEDISWDDAIDEIARWIKKTRDETFVEKDTEGYTVNRLRGDCLERRLHGHQRIQLSRRQDHAQPGGLLSGNSGPGLTRSNGLQFGAHVRSRRNDERLDRHQEHRHDVDHGREPGREPPVRLQVANRSQTTRNAKMIVVDPRFTRTAATADMFLQIRAGSDIAFLGGVIKYAIDNDRIAKEYLANYTNAAFIVKEGFKLPEDGLYSGFDPGAQMYDKSTWNYEAGGNMTGRPFGPEDGPATSDPGASPDQTQKPARFDGTGSGKPPSPAGGGHGASSGLRVKARVIRLSARARSKNGLRRCCPPNIAYDLSLQHPRCVFQLLKSHYSRYTPDMVERVTGISKDQFLKAADFYTSIRKNGDMKKVGTDYLCGGVDTAHVRHADHPKRRNTATPSRQHRTRRWRRQRVAWTRQYSRRDRYGRRVRYPARLFEDTQSRR